MSPLSLGDWLILRPGWLLAALVLAIASLRWKPPTSLSHWHKVLSPSLFDYLGAAGHAAKPTCHLPLLLAAMVALSLCKPVLRHSDDNTWRHSIGWIAVADVSRSMTLDDTVPSRLAAMREALSELSRQSAARPLALIVFSGDAFLVAPPAFDHSLFNEHAALLEHGIIPVEGSNLARALSLASAVIADSQMIKARVFVLGDGGGVNNSALAAARFMAEQGHRLDLLIFGSTAAPTATTDNTPGSGSNAVSWSHSGTDGSDETSVNWTQVQTLANAGNGIGVRANTFGVINHDPLKLSQQATASTHAELESLVWKDQSHHWLLLAIPVLLLLFRREADQ